ncbi:MAG: redox-regulated ATPase YchF [Candidatus Aenigmatarchaeota archaeon]
MKVALVGVPNSGKSTFLKAATLADVETNNYPFTTIEKNESIGYVRVKCACEELDKECNPRKGMCIGGTRFIPIKMVDVAGLVPGAHKGKGLGNQFLDDLRDAPALIHVLDASGRTDNKGEQAEDFDPYESVKTLEEELDFWFLNIFNREWNKLKNKVEIEHKDFEKQMLSRFSGLNINKYHLHKAIEVSDVNTERLSSWDKDDKLRFVKFLRRISKPVLIAANNVDLKSSEENIEELKKKTDEEIIPCCTEAELTLRKAHEDGFIKYIPGDNEFEIVDSEGLSEKQEKALNFIKKDVLDNFGSTGVQESINKIFFDLLGMIVVYPVENENKWTDKKENVLPDAHLVKKGTTAEELAFKIHSDIGEDFIGAINAKTGRKIGANYELKNGDVIKILT